MSNLLIPEQATTPRCQTGEVISQDREGRFAFVLLQDQPEAGHLRARYALPGMMRLTPGDEVLLTGNSLADLYIIGVLSNPGESSRLASDTGAYAKLQPHREGEKISVHRPSGEVIFEFQPETGRCRLLTGSPQLDISAENISLFAANTMQLGAAQLDLIAKKTGLEAEKIEVSGQELVGRVTKSRWVVDKFESISRTLITKTRNAYRTVEKLCQLRAGRSRTVVKESHILKCGRALHKSTEDYKIDGERIHLG